jgi:hypothetical protein
MPVADIQPTNMASAAPRRIECQNLIHIHVGESILLPIHVIIPLDQLQAFRQNMNQLFQRLLLSIQLNLRTMIDSIPDDASSNCQVDEDALSSSSSSSKDASAVKTGVRSKPILKKGSNSSSFGDSLWLEFTQCFFIDILL